MYPALSHLLTTDPSPAAPDLARWWPAVAPLRDAFPHPLDRALALGLTAPSVGGAFVASYRAALHALVPSLGVHTRAALCATEEVGAHPRAITTKVSPTPAGVVVDGAKRFVTGAHEADALLVLATRGADDDGRNLLSLVRVPAGAPGVALVAMAPTSFVPDVSHASVTFTAVALDADAVLPGDGWNRYVKPFRTVEDLHVQAGVTAWMIGALRRHAGPRPLVERLVAHAASLRALADQSPDDPTNHVALAGAFANLYGLFDAVESTWSDMPEALRADWLRDRRLMYVARDVRARRLEVAWAALLRG